MKFNRGDKVVPKGKGYGTSLLESGVIKEMFEENLDYIYVMGHLHTEEFGVIYRCKIEDDDGFPISGEWFLETDLELYQEEKMSVHDVAQWLRDNARGIENTITMTNGILVGSNTYNKLKAFFNVFNDYMEGKYD